MECSVFSAITAWKVEESPKAWGPYHLICWAVMILVTVLLCVFVGRKHSPKADRILVGTFGAVLLLAEVYKQIFYFRVRGYYRPYDFPFQFCSVPMWVMFFAGVLPEGKHKEVLYKFLATAGLVAGVAVMLFPQGVFESKYITILAHTMLWHGSMVVVGCYLWVSKGYARSLRDFVKEVAPGVVYLYGLILLALLVDVVWHLWIETPLKDYFTDIGYPKAFASVNFFYISPYAGCELVGLSWIRENAPYPVFLLTYFLAFTLGCALVWFAVFGLRKMVAAIAKRQEQRKQNAGK